MSHTYLFVAAISLFLAGLTGILIPAVWRMRAVRGEANLEGLLARLKAVDRYGVALVAAECIGRDHEGEAEGLEGWQVADLMGGLAGIEALAANCEVLIDLACYVQQWYPEALPVAEALRLNAREVQWHLERLKGAESRGHLERAFPDYARQAAATYYGMTQRVLALFAASDLPGLAQLSEAL